MAEMSLVVGLTHVPEMGYTTHMPEVITGPYTRGGGGVHDSV